MTDTTNYVLVEIWRYVKDSAYCTAKVQDMWLQVILNRKSLEECDLREQDVFEWKPNIEGIVKKEDIRNHPRDYSLERSRQIRHEFEELEKEDAVKRNGKYTPEELKQTIEAFGKLAKEWPVKRKDI